MLVSHMNSSGLHTYFYTMKDSKKILLLAVTVFSYFSNVQGDLKLVNVVFRHGDRAPDNNGFETYPNDPHAEQTFWPMGLGGLLNKGKMREYELGQYLRKSYGDFLGDVYVPKEVGTRSTDTDRTKMSLQLVLAGLYPPKGNQTWNKGFDWQPIPTHSVPILDDTLMVPEECPKYLRAREIAEASPTFQKKLASFKKLMSDLTKFSGKTIANSNDMYYLYFGLYAEKSMGLKMPEWADAVLASGELLDGINLEYEIFSYNAEMRRLNGGMLLRKFIENMLEVTKKSTDKHKIYLYSGHETNVAAMLQVLGIYEPHVPQYSSAVILELHEENGKYFVKVKYYKGVVGEEEEMVDTKVVPLCTENCSLYKFRSVLKYVTPTDDDLRCDKRSLRTTLQRNSIKVARNIITLINQQIAEDDKNRISLY